MSEWLESDNDEENSSPSDVFQPAKKRKLTKTLKPLKPKDYGKERFSETVSEEQVAVLSKGFVPANTSKNTKWAVNVFEAWVQSRNSRTEDEIDNGILRRTPVDSEELCRCLSLFVVEARRTDGKPYPPKMLYHLLTGLLCHMRDLDP